MSNHIFPLYLDGDIQATSSANEVWNGKTSTIVLTQTGALEVGEATIPGTMLNVIVDGLGGFVISLKKGPGESNKLGASSVQNIFNITAANGGTSVSFMWTGSAWLALSTTDSTVDSIA